MEKLWSAYGIECGARNFRPVTVYGDRVFSFDPNFNRCDTSHWMDEFRDEDETEERHAGHA